MTKLLTQAPVAGGVVLGIVMAARMLISKIGEPAVKRHFEHLDKNEVHMEKQTEALNSVKNCLDGMQRQQAEHIQICRTGSHDPTVRKPAQ